MEEKTVKAITTVAGALGTILILMSAFDIIPKFDNVLIFAGLSCFIVAGVIKKLAK
ncbi:MAG: hypothetical protein KJ995_06460 [Candidatus Omnitrophica bacterium]|nr:hypothetical protein [Candidatus Omnitrophota bacterium]MBU1128900.1 hypothetical protein [Candidatus Omnitrophota bacterium]MBU1784208.1 hypothetical protein [Candidatus Omnitrophota bacterium]MBU1852025.1 hypothetical protein [Candidatus Omnitrophota bacterium]